MSHHDDLFLISGPRPGLPGSATGAWPTGPAPGAGGADRIRRLSTDPGAAAAVHHLGADARAPHQADGPLSDLCVGNKRAGTGTVPNVIGVHLYLERHDKILLGLRHPDSVYAPSEHHFLAGHCEQESAVACLIREAKEEAGLVIAAEDVEFVHIVHVLDVPGTRPRMQLVFRARRWQGEPRVMEPDKCVAWAWWPADALPEPTVAYARAAIDGIRGGHLYTEMGWT